MMRNDNIPLHGGEADRPVRLDFSVNVNPLGIPESVRKALPDLAASACVYPDRECRELREALSQYLSKEYSVSISPEMFIPGNGASELLQILCRAVKPEKALITAPCFSGYERALKACGAGIEYYALRKEDGFALTEDFLRVLSEFVQLPDLIILCQPNNPVGNVIAPELLRKIADFCQERRIYLILDECFAELLNDPRKHSLVTAVSGNAFLIVLRAFTKTYAMPGLRLGYAVVSDSVLRSRIRELLPEWNVSGPAQRAGCAALNSGSYLEESRVLLRREHEYLEAELQALVGEVFDGEAGFLLFSVGEDRGRLRDLLLERGILIRDCANYRGLADDDRHYYRIAVRLHEENESLISAMKEILPGRSVN